MNKNHLLFLDANGNIVDLGDLETFISECMKDGNMLESLQNRSISSVQSSYFGVYRLSVNEANPKEGKVEFVSPSLVRIMGIPDPNNLSAWFQNLHPEDSNKMSKAIVHSAKSYVKLNESLRLYNFEKKAWRQLKVFSLVAPTEHSHLRSFSGIVFDVTDNIGVENELSIMTQKFEEMDTAIKVFIEKKDEMKKEIEKRVVDNFKELCEPLIKKLINTNLDAKQSAILNALESSLNDLVSSLNHGLSAGHYKLTSTEIQIANYIKHGKSSKEIAQLTNLSNGTVAVHREHIRKKLGIKNKQVNLRTHLLSFEN